MLLPDPVRADVAATILMIDGARRPVELATTLAVRDYLVVSDEQEILLSRSMAEKIRLNVNWPTRIVN